MFVLIRRWAEMAISSVSPFDWLMLVVEVLVLVLIAWGNRSFGVQMDYATLDQSGVSMFRGRPKSRANGADPAKKTRRPSTLGRMR